MQRTYDASTQMTFKAILECLLHPGVLDVPQKERVNLFTALSNYPPRDKIWKERVEKAAAAIAKLDLRIAVLVTEEDGLSFTSNGLTLTFSTPGKRQVLACFAGDDARFDDLDSRLAAALAAEAAVA